MLIFSHWKNNGLHFLRIKILGVESPIYPTFFPFYQTMEHKERNWTFFPHLSFLSVLCNKQSVSASASTSILEFAYTCFPSPSYQLTIIITNHHTNSSCRWILSLCTITVNFDPSGSSRFPFIQLQASSLK